MESKKLNQAYLETFFGDTGAIYTLTDGELDRYIADLIKSWTQAGDYNPETDPDAEAIYQLTRELYPYREPGITNEGEDRTGLMSGETPKITQIALATINTEKGTAQLRYNKSEKILTAYYPDGTSNQIDLSREDAATWYKARQAIKAMYGNAFASHDTWVLCLRPTQAIRVSTSEDQDS